MSAFDLVVVVRPLAIVGGMRLNVFLALGLFAASCAPSTGDALIDEVALEIAPFSDCIRVGQTQIFQESNEMGPPALLYPSSFKNAEARMAAAKLAKPWQTARYGEPQLFGEGTADNCGTTVNVPAFADEFAFLTFSEPGGAIGAYAFRRQGPDWQVTEKVQLGFW